MNSKIGITRSQIINAAEKEISNAEVDEYIVTKRALYAEKNSEQYKDFLEKYSSVKALNNTSSKDTVFFSKYVPLISVELTPDEITLLAKDKKVQSIYYSPEVSLVPESDNSVSVIRANYTRDTLGYTGSGIKIGMIEPNSLPNRNLSCFTSANIIYDPNVSAEYRDHSSIVAAIMVAKATTVDGVTYEGIVPDATLYATYYVPGDASDWRVRVEWLLSQGVNVINMSAGFSEATPGIYGTQELWLDHVAINHSVHFVKSAGNNSGSITSPGMANNILTVGSIDDNNTLAYGDDVRVSSSSYIEPSSLSNKPDLMAPGCQIYTAVSTDPNGTSGTSFAAPHVTAVVAQLCQRRPALKLAQDGMKAILLASINHSEHAYDTDDYEYDEYGAGVVDARSSFYTSDNNRFATSSFAANSASGSEKTYTFYVTSSDQKIRIALTWLKYSKLSDTHSAGTPTSHEIAELDLYVYDQYGVEVDSSASFTGNTEIITLDRPVAGTYTIVVRQFQPSTGTVYFGLAWW